MKGKTLFEAIGYADEKYVSRPFSKFYVSKARENASKIWDGVKIAAGVAAVIAVILAIWIPSVLLRGPQPSTSTTDTAAPDTEITSAVGTDDQTTAGPVVTEPPTTEPNETETPTTEAPVTEPPTTEPPVTEPPATEPPTTEATGTEPPATAVPVTYIDIVTNKNLVKVGESIKLTAYIKPQDATDKSVTWSITSGADCGTISQDGTFTGVKSGACIVTVTAADGSGLSASTHIAVAGPGDIMLKNGFKLIVNDVNITDQVSFNVDTSGSEPYVELPLTAIFRAFGRDVRWENENTVVLTYDGPSYTFKISERSMTGDGISGNWFDSKRTETRSYFKLGDDLYLDIDSIRDFVYTFCSGSVTLDVRKKRITVTDYYYYHSEDTQPQEGPEPLFEKEFEIKALINHAEGYDGKAKVRFTAYEEAEDVINGRRIDIELIGKDGSVLDSRKFHGYGFIALGENKDQNVSYIVIYDVMLHSDRTVTSGTAIILITDEDPDLYLEGVPHFTDFEAGAGIGSVPVYGRYLNAKRKDVALYYSKCTQVLYDAYSVCSGALYSVYECDEDGAGFYEYGELPVTEDRITSIGFTTIDDWAAYFNAFVLQDPSDLQDKHVL